jgi:hypothetical protein
MKSKIPKKEKERRAEEMSRIYENADSISRLAMIGLLVKAMDQSCKKEAEPAK